MLVTLWGDVPLVTESTSIPRTDYTRNAVAEVDGVIAVSYTHLDVYKRQVLYG